MKPKMVIVTESLRRDNQKPLQFFDKLEVLHFYYQAPYGDLSKEEFANTKKFNSIYDLYQKIIKEKPDIIQGTEPLGSKKAFFFSIACYLAAKRLRTPLIFPVWENRPLKEKFSLWQNLILTWWMKKYASQAIKIFYLNDGAKRNLLKLKTNKTQLVRFLWGTWGIDTKEFRPFSVQEEKLQTDISQISMILFVGRLEPAKGIKYLLQAYKKVVKRFPKTRLVLVGSGYLKDKIIDFRNKYHLEKNITIKGLIKNKNLPVYFQSATIFVSPAITLKHWEEQVGMTNLQAMACGTPVVSTISGAISEYVPNKIAGLLVPERDHDRLASAIIRILDDKKLRDKISQGARRYALINYDAEKNIIKAQDIILKIIHEKKSSMHR